MCSIPHQSRVILLIVILKSISADYWADRSIIISLEESEELGANVNLSAKETAVNEILMRQKLAELDDGFKHPENFLPAIHFFKSRYRIEKSNVFKFIQRLPKGSSLHSHDIALSSGEYVYNLTYRDKLYGCVKNGRLFLQFFPNERNNFCAWELVSVLRQANKTFDEFLKTQINILTDNPSQAYPDINDAWIRFQDTFETVGPMLCYEPVFKDYFYEALKELYQDNVMYLEFRSTLPTVYDERDQPHGPIDVVRFYIETLEIFKKNYPDFHGARLVYAPNRNIGNITMARYVQTASQLKKMFPDFIAGFDLVGQEDKGEPLDKFIPQLLEIGKEMKFFFHAGETNWNGMSTDFNLVDAVLLNSTRIGHGYDLLKHQEVLRMVKERGIAIEVNPISNQVLKLVDDIRNHPASVLINRGFNIVICCDDPSFWGAKGLSYDWYLAFMGMASRQSDLRFLKQLAINSILYSAMEPEEKQQALSEWEQKWNKFMDRVFIDYFYNYDMYNVDTFSVNIVT